MKSVSLVLQSALLSAGLFSCSGGTVGPCDVEFQTPVFEVTKVVNVNTNAAVAQIRLSNFTFTRADGFITHDLRTQIAGPHFGVTAATDGTTDLICDVSCGFGTEQGHYSLTVSAAGFAPKQIDYDVAYSSKGGGSNGCPLILSGPTTADIRLVPGA